MKYLNTANRTKVSVLFLAPLALSTLSLAEIPAADAASIEVSPAPSTQPVQVEQIVGAQINITRDSISHLMRTLQERGDDQSLAAPDYQAAQVAFAATADRVTRAYEQKLNQQVLRPMADLLVRYNSVLSAQSFSDTQRTMILNNIKTQLRALATSLKPKYKELLKEVYAVAGNLPFEYKIRLSDAENEESRTGGLAAGDMGWMRTRFYGIIDGNRASADRLEYEHGEHISYRFYPSNSDDIRVQKTICIGRCRNTGTIYSRDGQLAPPANAYPLLERSSYDSDGAFVFFISGQQRVNYRNEYVYRTYRQSQWLAYVITQNPRAFDSVFEELVFPTISQGCRSELCLMLKAADLTTYIALTYESLDRNLTFTAQDGFEITVRSPKLDHEHVIKLLMRQSNPDNLPYTVQ